MKMLYECRDTNFSSQFTEKYATTKLTSVATSVFAQPTPDEMLPASWKPRNTDTPSKAGIDRKNDSFVTVTRSKSRNRPADIVAPDRDTPGISAKHCATPITRESFQVTSSVCRTCVAA